MTRSVSEHHGAQNLTFTKRLVTTVPPLTQLVPEILYICIPYSTIVHLCACGCGNEVVTPLSPTDWRLSFDGEYVSITPSINNSGLKCRAHYWIDRSEIHWCREVSKDRVDQIRAADRRAKERYYSDKYATKRTYRNWISPIRRLLSMCARLWRRQH